MSITKVFNPRLNQYTYYTEENGQLIPLTYEDGLKQGLAVLEQIREHFEAIAHFNGTVKADYVLRILDKAIKEVEQ